MTSGDMEMLSIVHTYEAVADFMLFLILHNSPSQNAIKTILNFNRLYVISNLHLP
jgi:hypothetical protein